MPKNKHTEETKLAVVLEGLKSAGSIAEMCRKHGISDSLYYKWRDVFLEGGKRGLSGKNESPNMELVRRVSEYEKVIGRLTVQCEILKKTFPDAL
ncbi:MAG: transposase [Deltaproteobacteria bacterium]|nr:transposase [Deltaproteobacteria bacterium]